MKCIGHERVIDALSAKYKEGHMEISVVHGPYQVGKTYIAIELQQQHNAIYLTGRMSNEMANIIALNRALGHDSTIYSSLEDAFQAIFEKSKRERMMLIIDDYPALVEAVPKAPIMIRDLMKQYEGEGQLFIVVIGSAIEESKGRIIGPSSLIAPFINTYFVVEPLSLEDMKHTDWNFSDKDNSVIHRITNGMASYMAHFNDAFSLDENIVNLFFTPNGALFHEPQRILSRDIRNMSAANSILSALARMDRPFYSELSAASEIKSGTFATRLADLIDLDIVGRVQTAARGPMKYSDYHFTNTMFEFWYTYVFPNLEAIYQGKGQDIYDTQVKAHVLAH